MSKVAHAPSAAAPALGWGAGGFCGVLKDAQEGCWGTGWGAGWAAGVGCWKAAKPTPGDGALGAGDDMPKRSTTGCAAGAGADAAAWERGHAHV